MIRLDAQDFALGLPIDYAIGVTDQGQGLIHQKIIFEVGTRRHAHGITGPRHLQALANSSDIRFGIYPDSTRVGQDWQK